MWRDVAAAAVTLANENEWGWGDTWGSFDYRGESQFASHESHSRRHGQSNIYCNCGRRGKKEQYVFDSSFLRPLLPYFLVPSPCPSNHEITVTLTYCLHILSYSGKLSAYLRHPHYWGLLLPPLPLFSLFSFPSCPCGLVNRNSSNGFSYGCPLCKGFSEHIQGQIHTQLMVSFCQNHEMWYHRLVPKEQESSLKQWRSDKEETKINRTWSCQERKWATPLSLRCCRRVQQTWTATQGDKAVKLHKPNKNTHREFNYKLEIN